MASKRIRGLLRSSPDGMTTSQIAEAIGVRQDSAAQALPKMPDAYIDRWTRAANGHFVPVWCVVAVPEHCPKPTTRRKK